MCLVVYGDKGENQNIPHLSFVTRISSYSLELTDQQHGRPPFLGTMDRFLRLFSLISNSVHSLRALSVVLTSPRDVLVCGEV